MRKPCARWSTISPPRPQPSNAAGRKARTPTPRCSRTGRPAGIVRYERLCSRNLDTRPDFRRTDNAKLAPGFMAWCNIIAGITEHSPCVERGDRPARLVDRRRIFPAPDQDLCGPLQRRAHLHRIALFAGIRAQHGNESVLDQGRALSERQCSLSAGFSTLKKAILLRGIGFRIFSKAL